MELATAGESEIVAANVVPVEVMTICEAETCAASPAIELALATSTKKTGRTYAAAGCHAKIDFEKCSFWRLPANNARSQNLHAANAYP